VRADGRDWDRLRIEKRKPEIQASELAGDVDRQSRASAVGHLVINTAQQITI
jgi:hypothetical protein